MDLLDQINAFPFTTIGHPYLTAARRKLVLALKRAVKGNIIFMFGPTGVGKSTLFSHLQTYLVQELQLLDTADPGAKPVALFEATSPENHRFSWKDFYLRALSELHEPLIDRKLVDPPHGFTRKVRTDSAAPAYELRFALENALRYRKTKVLMIDEAQHIARGTSASGLYDQLEYLKSLANLTNTIIVLGGTYDLLAFRNLNGQLSRRSNDVHFPRYNAKNKKELTNFVNVVATFANKIPYQCDFELTDRTNELYVGSMGCVGVLSGWLYKAMHGAYAAGDELLTWRHLEETIFTYDQMDKMASELLEGERLLKAPKDGFSKIGARLGLPRYEATKDSQKSGERGQSRKGRVGDRKPTRDPIGVRAEG